MSQTRSARLEAAMASLAALVVLIDCSDDAPQAQPTESATSESTSASEPTPTPSRTDATKPTPPALPAAAKEDSKAGAKAFVGWYVDLFNYSANTGDVAVFSEYGEQCASCQNYASEIKNTYAQGGAFRGVQWVDDRYFVDDTDDGYFVSVGINASEYSRRTTPNGKFAKAPAESFELSFDVKRASSAFEVRDIRVPS